MSELLDRKTRAKIEFYVDTSRIVWYITTGRWHYAKKGRNAVGVDPDSPREPSALRAGTDSVLMGARAQRQKHGGVLQKGRRRDRFVLVYGPSTQRLKVT